MKEEEVGGSQPRHAFLLASLAIVAAAPAAKGRRRGPSHKSLVVAGHWRIRW